MLLQTKQIIIYLLCCGLFFACDKNNTQNREEPIARVFDKYLYPSDVQNLIPENTNAEDSAKILDAYVDSWVRHNLILKIAENNLQSRLPEIDKQAKEYRESLVIYAYEKQWLAENLDTLISEDTLVAYYNAHPEQFILKQDIYQLRYAIVDKSIKSFDSLRLWFSKDIDKYRNEMESYCLNNCKNYLFDAESWLSEDALFNMLPLQIFENNKLRSAGLVEYADNENRYIVKVKTYKTEGTVAPFEYIQNDVKQIIIGKRKMDIVKKNYADMYSEGMRQQNAELYKNEKK